MATRLGLNFEFASSTIDIMEDNDATMMLQKLLNDLLIYEPSDTIETVASRPKEEDLANINSKTAIRGLEILQRYVRPRNDVLQIRRAVNAALLDDNVGEGNIYSRYLDVKRDVAELKEEKARMGAQLDAIRGPPSNGNGARNALLGTTLLQKAQKQVQLLRIYRKHLKMLVVETEKVDNQTTLVLPSQIY
jgi:hypothetical protein